MVAAVDELFVQLFSGGTKLVSVHEGLWQLVADVQVDETVDAHEYVDVQVDETADAHEHVDVHADDYRDDDGMEVATGATEATFEDDEMVDVASQDDWA